MKNQMILLLTMLTLGLTLSIYSKTKKQQPSAQQTQSSTNTCMQECDEMYYLDLNFQGFEYANCFHTNCLNGCAGVVTNYDECESYENTIF